MAARIRTKGDIHKITELTSSIKLDNIHQIFTPITSDDQYPVSILMAGIGKTTLAKEICLQWVTINYSHQINCYTITDVKGPQCTEDH